MNSNPLVTMQEFSIGFQPRPEAIRLSRQAVSETLQRWGLADFGPDAILVVSELLTNVVQHGSAEALAWTAVVHVRLVPDLRLGPHQQRLEIGVSSAEPQAPELKVPQQRDDAESGRGMLVIIAVTGHDPEQRPAAILGIPGYEVLGWFAVSSLN